MGKLIINMKIYHEKYILNAIKEYKSIVNIDAKFDRENEKAVLVFNCREDNRQLFHDEFCNYLISIIAISL